MDGLTHARLTARQRGAVLLVPWAFVALYAVIYLLFLFPRVLGGGVLAIIGVLVAVVWLVFAVAAVTFSRDVLRGLWPSET